MASVREQIPYLIQLLDDDAAGVRHSVMQALEKVGPDLGTLTEPLLANLNPEQLNALQVVLVRQRKSWLREQWPKWHAIEGRAARIEAAMGLLVKFQFGFDFPISLGDLLDDLALRFQHSGADCDVLTLAKFLFEEYTLHGNKDDFHNPHNSNLISVILSKKGIPISLVAIYILVGQRLGLDIEGCDVPHHFLARVIYNGDILLVDCFSQGRVLETKSIPSRSSEGRRQLRILRNGTSSLRTMQRVLQNLNHAYRRSRDHDLSAFMIELLGLTIKNKTG